MYEGHKYTSSPSTSSHGRDLRSQHLPGGGTGGSSSLPYLGGGGGRQWDQGGMVAEQRASSRGGSDSSNSLLPPMRGGGVVHNNGDHRDGEEGTMMKEMREVMKLEQRMYQERQIRHGLEAQLRAVCVGCLCVRR